MVLGLLAHAEAAQAAAARRRRWRRRRTPPDRRPSSDRRSPSASGGIIDSAASATSTIPSGRHAVCLVSRNHELVAPDLSVNSPRLTEWASTWSRRAASGGSEVGQRPRPISCPADVTARDQLRIFTEPQQGATYDDLLAVARRAEQLGFGAFFRSDHYLAMGRWLEAGGLPGPTDAWITLAGLARDTTHDPPRHARHVGDVPPAGPAGDLGRRRRPDVGRSRRARARAPAGTRPSTRRTASRSPSSASASTASRSSSPSSPACGRRRSASAFTFDGGHYPVTDSPALPKPVQDGGVPIIVGGGGPSARRPWPPATPPSSTRRSSPSTASPSSAGAVAAACAAIGRDPASMRFSAAAVVCRRRRRGRVRAAGRRRSVGSPAELRADRRRRNARRGRRRVGTVVRGRRRAPLPPGARPRPTSITSTRSPPIV